MSRASVAAAAIVSIAALAFGCAARHAVSNAITASRDAKAEESGAQRPGATVQIDYAHKDDFLRSVKVTKFTGAQRLSIDPGEEKPGTSVVRFDGGVPVWEIRADEGVTREVLTEIPLIAAGSKYALKSLKYGTVPRNFLQVTPDSGPPEPLESANYYVFEIERASGSINFEAIKIEDDGDIVGYDAQPRAGESFALCCNVNADFAYTQSR